MLALPAPPGLPAALSSGRPKPSGAAGRTGQILAFLPFHRIIASHNQLRDLVAFFDHVIFAPQVEHDDADFAAIAGIDSAKVHGDRVLERQAAAGTHLRLMAARQFDSDARGYA